nr:GNAT family N-acetyltransferase [Blastococcus saxobsidens]
MSARSARSLRRLRRNLERDVGTVASQDVAAAADPVAVEAEVEAFLAMEMAGWKGRAGTAMANTADHAAFFREACAGFAAAGRLRLWRLEAGDVAAARECHLHAGETIFTWKTAFNEELGRFSPGVQLELDVLGAFHDDARARWLDNCTADVPSTSARLTADRRLMGDVLIGVSRLGRTMAWAVPLVAAAWSRTAALRRRGRTADQD